MSLVARHLEAAGIPTVILGSAIDIVEHCGVPRFLFTDFPLGNPCGRPWDMDMQRDIVTQALSLFETATGPRTTQTVDYRVSEDQSWRERYLEVRPEDLTCFAAKDDELRLRCAEAAATRKQ